MPGERKKFYDELKGSLYEDLGDVDRDEEAENTRGMEGFGRL